MWQIGCQRFSSSQRRIGTFDNLILPIEMTDTAVDFSLSEWNSVHCLEILHRVRILHQAAFG